MPTESVQQHAAELRGRAEARVRTMESQAGAPPSSAEAERLIHELRVHQIELEMQNEELIRTQVELETLRARYFDLYHLAPVGYLTLSEKGLILEVNLRTASLLGIPSGTLVKRSLSRFIHRDDADVYYRYTRQLWQTGKPQTCEVRLDPRRDGAAITWVRLDMALAQDEKERDTVCRAILSDISQWKAAEHALRASEERYRLLTMLSPDGISVTDQTGRILACNEQFAHMHHADDSAKVVGRNAQELAGPEAIAGLCRAVAAALERGESVARDIEVEVLRSDGSSFPGEYSIAPIPWADAPAGVAYLSNIRDITKRKELAAELERHRLHLEELVRERTRELQAEVAGRTAAQAALGRSEHVLAEAERIAHLGSWERDLATNEYRWSDEIRGVFDVTPGDPLVMRAAIWATIHPEDHHTVEADYARVLQAGESLDHTYRIVRPNGEIRVVRGRLEVLRDAAGQPRRVRGIVQDITEQAAAQAALQHSEANLAASQRMAHVGSWTRDLRTAEYGWSAEMYRIFGLDARDPGITPDHFWNILHPAGQGPAEAIFRQVVQTGETHDAIHRIVLPSGEPRVVRALTELVRDEAGQPLRVNGTVQDITEQERARAALDRHVQELSSLQALGHLVSLALPLEQIVQTYLDRLLALADLDMAQVFLLQEGRLHLAGVRTALPGPAAQAQTLDVGECLCGRAVQEAQIVYAAEVDRDPRCTNRHCHANGLRSLAALPLRSEQAVIIGALAVGAVAPDAFADRLTFLETAANLIAGRLRNALLHREIRARAADLEATVAERTRALQAERDRIQAILETVGESVVVTDLAGRLLFVNPATTTLTGHARDETLGLPIWRQWMQHTRTEIWPAAQRALRGGQVWHGEISGQRQDGTVYTAALTGMPLYDVNTGPDPVGAVWAQRDITALKNAARLKDQFVANVSHELRTPVSIITLNCDNLRTYQARLDEGQRAQFLQEIDEQAHVLKNLIEDILTISRIDGRHSPGERRLLDLAELVREEVTRQRPLAERRSQHLVVNAAMPVMVPGSEGQLHQAVRNLLDNALKYTPDGGQISCSCKIVPCASADAQEACQGTAEVCAVVEITDNGIGIDAKDLPFIFDRFYRAAGESNVPGTGLGLPIAQELVRLHGGRITILSTAGAGSTFTVYLPLTGEH